MDQSALLETLSTLIDKDNYALPHLPQESIEALYSLAFELYRNGKYVDARQIFRFLTLADTFDRRFWMGLAASYHMLKEYQPAIECYSVAANQEPSDPYVHWHAAACFFADKQIDKGLIALDAALNAAKENNTYTSLIPQIETMQYAWSEKRQAS